MARCRSATRSTRILPNRHSRTRISSNALCRRSRRSKRRYSAFSKRLARTIRATKSSQGRRLGFIGSTKSCSMSFPRAISGIWAWRMSPQRQRCRQETLVLRYRKRLNVLGNIQIPRLQVLKRQNIFGLLGLTAM